MTLEPALAKELEELAHRRGESVEQTLNDVVRRGLDQSAPRYKVTPYDGRFRPGTDTNKLNQFVDELEVEDFVIEV